MQLDMDDAVIARLNKDLAQESYRDSPKLVERERASRRIKMIMQGTARKRLNMEGEVTMFGSFSNGFKTGNSDLDIVFLGRVGPDETPVSMLSKFALLIPEFGFENITKIFAANVPLLKFTDEWSQMEVDFCINNELGVRNSQLLWAYSEYDYRVVELGRLVKHWAKEHDLVGSTDGFLNSYAYMLLVIFFLQHVQPPVVPNLQLLATESVYVTDHKWGGQDHWDTKFEDNISALPPSSNTMSLGELLVRFLDFYGRVFNWSAHAVCMRLNRPGTFVDKFSLMTTTNELQWYVEDPFDLKHNLAGKCTLTGRQRILEALQSTLEALKYSSWEDVVPRRGKSSFFMKCRVSQGVSPQALLEEFESFDLLKLHFPKTDGTVRAGQAYLEFASAAARRQAHTKNETYVSDCQLQLHYSSEHSLQEALGIFRFTSFDVASYKMQKQVIHSRVHQGTMPVMFVGQPQQQHQSKTQHRRGANNQQAQYPMEANMFMGQMPDQGFANFQRQAQLQHHAAMMQPHSAPHGHPQHALAANHHVQPSQSLPQQPAMLARPDVVRAHQKAQAEAARQAALQMAKASVPHAPTVATPVDFNIAPASTKNVQSNFLDPGTLADDENIRPGQNNCLRCPLNYELPEEIPASLTEEQIAPLRNFLRFERSRRRSPPQSDKQKVCEVTIQVKVELASDMRCPAIPADAQKHINNFLEMYSKAKPVATNPPS
mmetsp:Transcript_92912/g.184435  ORF Transcript_92912/g.184435 Transcript_92912/m.184435 type:complete len:715 (-) Transcript_92912:168-2312(-)